jgi:hypothetical protein
MFAGEMRKTYALSLIEKFPALGRDPEVAGGIYGYVSGTPTFN